MLEFNSDLGSDRWHNEAPGLNARRRYTGHGPTRRSLAQNVRDLCDDATLLLRIDVIEDQAAVLAVISVGAAARGRILWSHKFTVGTVETKPFRVKVKFCLYSPRLIL